MTWSTLTPRSASSFGPRHLAEGYPSILHRETDPGKIRANHRAACDGFEGDGSPDEYPFASTIEGGAGARVAGVPRLLEWFLFGSRGDPERTLADQTGDVLAGLLLVGAALFLGSVLYLALLLVVGRRRPRLQRRVIALVLSPTVGIIIWLWGPFSLGTLIYGLGFPVLCGVFVRFPNGDMPGHLVLTVPEQREETEPANGDKGVGSSPGNGNDSPHEG